MTMCTFLQALSGLILDDKSWLLSQHLIAPFHELSRPEFICSDAVRELHDDDIGYLSPGLALLRTPFSSHGLE